MFVHFILNAALWLMRTVNTGVCEGYLDRPGELSQALQRSSTSKFGYGLSAGKDPRNAPQSSAFLFEAFGGLTAMADRPAENPRKRCIRHCR